MIDEYYSDYFITPLLDFGLTKGYSNSHRGLDFGYVSNACAPVYPIQEGKVVDTFESYSCGKAVVVEHTYPSSHRWSAYIHLSSIGVKVGDVVRPLTDKNPSELGKRGNSGHYADGSGYGYHLHLYVTAKTTKSYNWNYISQSSSTTLSNFNPLPYIYRTNIRTYVGATCGSYPVFEDIPKPIEYPKPIERDTTRKQIKVLIDYLYMRDAPNGKAYAQYAQKGIYNVLEEQINGNYCWYKIDVINANSFWVASGGTRTEDLLPEGSKEQELDARVEELQQELNALTLSNAFLNEELATAKDVNEDLTERIKKALEALES